MSDPDARSIPALLVRVLELAPGERLDWLREHADASVVDQVLELARQADEEGTVAREDCECATDPDGSGDSAGSGDPGRSDEAARKRLGRLVGNYRLTEVLGQGGMGAVYLGERQGDYEHVAAIKLARPNVVSSRVLERMAQERQILAHLDHPNIAHLLDGGTTQDGEIFLVLEYVDGREVTRFCWERDLSQAETLELFLDICDAVTAAHRALLVHGDLKPSNILVREDGVPKLLDFGVARALGGPESTAEVLGWTPGFASPEQLLGKPVGVASDVYSLGALLRLLLTRQPPTRLPPGVDAATYLETLEAREVRLRERPVDAPDASLADLPRELRAILQTCQRLEPRDRYPSVDDLADDLRRYLEHRPVGAVAGGRFYRGRKFVERHRLAVAASLIAGVALVASWGLALQQAEVARFEAGESEMARVRADRINAFLLSIFESANIENTVSVGPEVRVVDVLQQAADRVWADDAMSADDRLNFVSTLVDLHQNLAQYEAADALLDRALRFVAENPGAAPIQHARLLRLAAHGARFAGDVERAAETFARALEVLVDTYGSGSDDFEVLDLELAIRAEYVFVLRLLYRCEEGMRVVGPVLALRDQLEAGGESVEEVRLYDNLSGALSNVASCQWAETDYESAYEIALEALHWSRATELATEQLAATQNNCGFYALALERWELARDHYREAIAVSDALGVGDLRNAHRYLMLARAEAMLGERVSAAEHLARGLELARELYADRTPTLSIALARAGEAALALGEVERSIELYEEAVRSARAAGLEDGRSSEHQGRLATVLHRHRPDDPRIVPLLRSATSGDRLTGNRREREIRGELEELLRRRVDDDSLSAAR